MADRRLISSDSHVAEPPDLWTSRLGERFGSRVPHVGKNAGSGMYGDWTGRLGGDWFVVEGIPAFPMVFGTLGPYKGDERLRRLKSFDFAVDSRPAAYETAPRLEDMATDGVSAEVIYPSYMARMLFMRDANLQRACAEVYNDWVIDFCAPARDQLWPMSVISLVDAAKGAEELQRTLKKGARGAAIWCVPPPEMAFSSSHYERFWAAAAEARVPVALHALPPLDTMNVYPRAKSPFVEDAAVGLIEDFHLANILFNHHIQRSLAQLILSGVLERHPNLRLVVCEWGTSWLPEFLGGLDWTYSIRNEGLSLKLKPSEYVERQVWFTFDRELGLPPDAVARFADRLVWSSDYPHIETSWPASRQTFESIAAGLTNDVQEKLAWRNCEALYSR